MREWCGMWNLSVEPWILPLWSRTWTRFQHGRRRSKGRKFHFNTRFVECVLQRLCCSICDWVGELQPALVLKDLCSWIQVRLKYIWTVRWRHFHLSQIVSQRAYACSLLTQISSCTSLSYIHYRFGTIVANIWGLSSQLDYFPLARILQDILHFNDITKVIKCYILL